METSLTNASNALTYADWGGLPAELSDLKDFEAVRSEDCKIQRLFHCLDELGQAICSNRPNENLLGAVPKCDFSKDDINYLNSPLLDGLVHAFYEENSFVTGRPVRSNTSQPCLLQSIADHLIEPYCYLHTIRILLTHTNIRKEISDPTSRPYAVQALLIAAGSNNMDLVHLLLAHEFPVSPHGSGLVDHSSFCALCVACAGGYQDVVIALLDAGFSAAGDENCGMYQAISNVHVEVVELLLKRGASALESRYGNLLAETIFTKDVRLVRLLLAHGGLDLRQADSAVADAVRTGSIEILEALLNAAEVINEFPNLNHASLLAEAVQSLHPEMLRYLLGRCVNVVAETRLALRAAIRHGRVQALQMLLEAGACANQLGDVVSPRPLISAIRQRPFSHEVFALLVRHGTDVRHNEDEALHVAVGWNYQDVVRRLLDLGCDIHSGSERALFTAIQDGSVDMVRLLIQCGANVHVGAPPAGEFSVASRWTGGALPHPDRDYPLQYATLYARNVQIMELLLQAGCDVRWLPRAAGALTGIAPRCAMFTLLRAHGYDIVSQDSGPVLRSAVLAGDKAAVNLLLDWGADVHTDNDLALGVAVSSKAVSMVALLLARGASVGALDHAPLRTALLHEHESSLVDLLVQHGASMEVAALPGMVAMMHPWDAGLKKWVFPFGCWKMYPEIEADRTQSPE